MGDLSSAFGILRVARLNPKRAHRKRTHRLTAYLLGNVGLALRSTMYHPYETAKTKRQKNG